MKYTKELLQDILEVRDSIFILQEGKIEEIHNVEYLNEDDISSIEEIYDSIDERVQIKRKYGEHSAYTVNNSGPIRNRIVEFIGNRFVTEKELKNFLVKLEEDRGNAINDKKWFANNQRYFESFENRGQKVWTLSKFGNRILEFIIRKQSQKQINESIGLFKFSILSESNDSLDESINDPILIALRAAKEERKKALLSSKEVKKMRVYGKKREALENQLDEVFQDLKDLNKEKTNLYREMDMEAGEKGDKWTDADGNRYGQELNDIDDKISALITKRVELERKLAY
jgi:hypothetical protein